MARTSPRNLTLTITCLAGLALSAPALAQDALGDGTALDANLEVGSGGRNPDAVDFRRELAFRNAIVTGNVPGGFAFRGDVGYSAANDFRGSTAADDIFAFQRDAFFSGLATRGINGISAIQTSLAYGVTGQSSSLVGDVIINRPGAGTSVENLATQQRFDIFASIDGSLRAPSSITLSELQRPTFLNVQQDQSGRSVGYIGASDLMGVRALPPENAMFGAREAATEDAMLERLRQDPTLSTPVEDDDEDEAPGIQLPTHSELLRSLGVPLGTEDLITDPNEDEQEGANEGAGGLPDPLSSDPLAPVRRVLQEEEWRANPFNRVISDGDNGQGNPFADPLPDAGEGEEGADESVPTPAHTFEQRVQEAIEAAEAVLGRPVVLDDLRAGLDDPVFTRHMDTGMEQLQEGRWFDAEEHFAAALQLAPGDPIAAIGRLHAQIGAGMFLSAGANLRRLYTAYPELMAARVPARFLPEGERLEKIRALLRLRMGQFNAMNDDAAALLAYLGIQTGNQTDVEEGLARYRELSIDPETGEPDVLSRLLEGAWLHASDQEESAP